MIFVTRCPTCKGHKISNIDFRAMKEREYTPYYIDKTIPITLERQEPIPCEMCKASGLVIVELKSPYVAYED